MEKKKIIKKIFFVFFIISFLISIGLNYSLWNELKISENRVNALLSSGMFD